MLILLIILGILVLLVPILATLVLSKSQKRMNAEKPDEDNGNGDVWYRSLSPSVVIKVAVPVIIIGILVWWILHGTHGTFSPDLQSPSTETVWEWTKSHWLWVLLLVGIAYVSSYFITKDKEKAKKLQGVAVALVLILFVGIPIIAKVAGPSVGTTRGIALVGIPQGIPQVQIPLASSPQSSWPKLVIPAGSKSELVPVPIGMHIVTGGNGFRLHNVYIDGRDCAFGESCTDGPLKGDYMANETDATIIVSYAFAPS